MGILEEIPDADLPPLLEDFISVCRPQTRKPILCNHKNVSEQVSIDTLKKLEALILCLTNVSSKQTKSLMVAKPRPNVRERAPEREQNTSLMMI